MSSTPTAPTRIAAPGKAVLALAGAPLPTAMVIFLAVATQVVANELNRLVSEVLAGNGHVYALSDVLGWGAATQLDDWTAWSTANASPVPFIVGNTVADLIFIGCYAILASRLIRAGFTGWLARHPGAAATPTLPATILLLLVIADLAEDVLLLVLCGMLSHSVGTPTSFGALPFLLAAATYLKLAALLGLVGYVMLSDRVGTTVRLIIPRALRAIYAQRLVVLVVLAIGLMSLVSRADLFEQVSDIYRSLLTFPASGAAGIPAVDVRALSLVASDVLTGLVLYAVSRERVRQYASRTTAADDRTPARFRGWLIAAAALAVPGAILAALSHWRLVDAVPFFTLLGALLLLPISSMILRALRVPMLPTFGRTLLAPHAREVEVAGNVLVATWAAICFFAPFKAMISPLFLAATGAFGAHSSYRFSAPFLLGLELALLAGGVLIGGVAWRRLRNGASRLAGSVGSTNPNSNADPGLRAFNWWMFGVSAAILLLSLVFPALAGATLGPLGAFVLILGAWAAILGTLVRVLSRQRPLELFALLRLRATPIVTLLVAVPLVISLVDSVPGLHAVRFDGMPAAAASSSGTPETTRPPLSVAFQRWLDVTDAAGCSAPLTASDGTTVHVRPLLLIAAQGGGIRAATWTVDVLDQLSAAGGCANDSTLLSSGASGGSVGLATFHDQNRSAAEQATNSTTPFAGQEALGVAIVGLLDGDLLGGMTGVRIPTATDPFDLSGNWSWHDRTALQELAWERQVPAFRQPFTSTPVNPTGYLVLNSTDSVTDCKVLVAGVDLGTTSTSAVPDCNGSGVNLSNTIDLSDTLGDCFWNLQLSTAAELSARFPVISSPGRIDRATVPANCRKGLAAMQLVDGGTTDNSAIGTLADVAPALSGLIGRENAGQDGSSAKPFVIPVVVYASNYPGLDLTATASRIKPDALVPVSILGDAQAAEATPAAWLTRAASAYAQVCTGYAARHPDSAGPSCSDALAALRGAVPRGVVVVSPSTSPAVSVPLGWTLSGFSEAQLLVQARQQASCGQAEAEDVTATCRTYEGYGTYGALLTIFRAEG